jgi:predicted transcriptional regulator
MRVRDAMQRHVTTVHQQDSLGLAQQLMRWSELRELPVADQRERVVGVISEHDLLRALTAFPADALKHTVDEFMCLHQPEPFFAVGQHYRVFAQTSDEEVERLLRKARALRAQKTASGSHGL